MKVRLKEDISIKELSKNNWCGCRHSTLKFIDMVYNTDKEQDVFVTTQKNERVCIIKPCREEYTVNLEALEIIEEDKEIKHINIQYWDDEEYTPEQRINVCMTVIDKLIDEVNELKKGK